MTGNQHISCTKRVNKSVILFPLIPLCGMAGKSKLSIREGNPASLRAAGSGAGGELGLRGLTAVPRGSLLSLAPMLSAAAHLGSGLLSPAPASVLLTQHPRAACTAPARERASFRDRQRPAQTYQKWPPPRCTPKSCPQKEQGTEVVAGRAGGWGLPRMPGKGAGSSSEVFVSHLPLGLAQQSQRRNRTLPSC